MEKRLLSIILILTISFFSFSGLKAQVTEKTNKVDLGPRYGEDSILCITNISLYREFYKQWKESKYKNCAIDDAIKPWRWVFFNCPRGTQNTYVDGVKIVKYLIKKEKEKDNKDKYIDTLMMVYDQRIKYYSKKEGSILGRKGVDLFGLRTSDFEKAYNIFKRSVELEGNKSAGPVLVYYFRSTIKMAKAELIDNLVIVETFDIITEIIDYNIKKNEGLGKSTANWENIKGNIELSFEPYATCENLLGIFQKKFDEKSDDFELLKKIIKTLDKKDCDDDQLFFDATLKLYELEPSPISAYLIGKMFLKQENFTEAIKYLPEGAKLEDPEDVANSYILLAESYRSLKNYPKSRSYALKALEVRPNEGSPLIIIGDMYAASASKCEATDLTNAGGYFITKKVAYWVAVDKYQRAKKIDPSLSGIANSRIKSYTAHFPPIEAIFYNNHKEGDSYKVGCWINETTTMRAAK